MSLRFAWTPEICDARGPSHSPSDNLGPLFCCVVSFLETQGRLEPVCVAVEWISMATQTHTHCCVWKAGGRACSLGPACWLWGQRQEACHHQAQFSGFPGPSGTSLVPRQAFIELQRTCTQYPA